MGTAYKDDYSLTLLSEMCSLFDYLNRACISRFKDCPLCGADIENIEPDADLQTIVDRFIDGHARIKRSQLSEDAREVGDEQKKVIYEDVSMERGAFLVQQAMRVRVM